MKFRFKIPELVVLLCIFLLIGFTIGHLTYNGFNILTPSLITEKMMLVASFGIIIPLLFAIYIISRSIMGLGHSGTNHRRSSTTRKRNYNNA